MKIAIVADWLVSYAGSERVLEQMLACFPEADVFSIVDFVPDSQRAFLQGKQPMTSFIQSLPGARRFYRHYLPLMPLAIEQFDLSAYDLILSSSHAVAKGVIVGPDQLHISYVHSPIRYAWDLQHQYLHESGLDRRWLVGSLARYLLHRIRLWDVRTPLGVDCFIANSGFIQRRIQRVYGRSSHVIYPPVDIEAFTPGEQREDFYLAASRMVPYKRMDLIVRAFSSMPDKKLIVIGDGPDFAKVEAAARPNITLMGYQSFDILRDHMRRAKAFVFAAEEDFGITPVEAQACGSPVIAYGKGGVLETVMGSDTGHPPTGIFFDQQTVDSIVQAVTAFETQAERFDSGAIRRNAERFSVQRFRDQYKALVTRELARWQSETGTA